jgi:hypothetical protein
MEQRQQKQSWILLVLSLLFVLVSLPQYSVVVVLPQTDDQNNDLLECDSHNYYLHDFNIPFQPKESLKTNYTIRTAPRYIPVIDYLTKWLDNVYFEYKHYGSYMELPPLLAQREGFDVMMGNPYRAACIESENDAVTLASLIKPVFVPSINQSKPEMQYGGFLYTLKNRSIEISTVHDINDNHINGTNLIDGVATHLCYNELLEADRHFLQDPKQTIFYTNSNLALEAI